MKYRIFINGQYLESYATQSEAEARIRCYRRMDLHDRDVEGYTNPLAVYEIRTDAKENAIPDFLEMTRKSWTYKRMTPSEQGSCETLLLPAGSLHLAAPAIHSCLPGCPLRYLPKRLTTLKLFP